MRVRKNDTVIAISGTSKGQKGKVLDIIDEDRVLVEGLNQIKKTQKRNASEENPQGGIIEIEAPLQLSKLMLFCPDCKKGVKLRIDRSSGKAARFCRACGGTLD